MHGYRTMDRSMYLDRGHGLYCYMYVISPLQKGVLMDEYIDYTVRASKWGM